MFNAHGVCSMHVAHTRIPPLKLLLYYGAHRLRKYKIFISISCSLLLLFAIPERKRASERGRNRETYDRILQKSRSRLHFHFVFDFCCYVSVEYEQSFLARHAHACVWVCVRAHCIPFQHIKLDDGFQENERHISEICAVHPCIGASYTTLQYT